MVPATGASRTPDHASGIMAKVEIYTSIMCPYCSRAVGLLKSKNISFEQIDVSMSGTLRKQCIAVPVVVHLCLKSLLMMNISAVVMTQCA